MPQPHSPARTMHLQTSHLGAAHKIALFAASYGLAVLLGACGDPTGGGGRTDPPPTPPAVTFRLTGIQNLTPGATGRVTGTAFNTGLPATATLDGQTVSLTRVSDTEATFTVPTLRPCDTDGRSVGMTAGTATTQGTLELADTVAMAVGESRLVTAAEASCVKLPAGSQEFALTAVNLEPYSMATVEFSGPTPLRVLANLTTFSASGGEPSGAFATTVPIKHRAERQLVDDPARPETVNPPPFDPAYTTAQVGGSLRMVEWRDEKFRNGTLTCTSPKALIPTYEARVIAVVPDAASNIELVVAADMRHADAANVLRDADKAFYTRAAQIAAPLIIPAMRAVFDPAYQPLVGGGRRVLVLIGDAFGAAGIDSDGGTGELISECAIASEMTTMVVSIRTNQNSSTLRKLASDIVHEYAHNADVITGKRVTGRRRGASTWFVEAFAVAAEDAALRISSGQDMGASDTRLSESHPTSARGGFIWGSRPDFSIFHGAGQYEVAASLLLYAREQIGDASVRAPGPHLYQRLLRRPGNQFERWSIESLAAEVGTTAPDLLDRWSLAHAADDLVDPAAAAARGLPQIQTWDHRDQSMDQRDALYNRTSRKVARSSSIRRSLASAPGNYAAAYFVAEGGSGISFTLGDIASDVTRVRLTRLR